MNLLQSGANWLAGQAVASFSVAVTYVRGTVAVPLQAVAGAKLYRTTDRNGVTRTERVQRDWILEATDIASIGLPQRGDQVRFVNGGNTEIYEVVSLDASETTYQNIDNLGVMLRVHTKYVGVLT